MLRRKIARARGRAVRFAICPEIDNLSMLDQLARSNP
jgi:hypothetical protein